MFAQLLPGRCFLSNCFCYVGRWTALMLKCDTNKLELPQWHTDQPNTEIVHIGVNNLTKQKSEILKNDFTYLLSTIGKLKLKKFIGGPILHIRSKLFQHKLGKHWLETERPVPLLPTLPAPPLLVHPYSHRERLLLDPSSLKSWIKWTARADLTSSEPPGSDPPEDPPLWDRVQTAASGH